jgi:hypothetical protein
MSLSPMLQDEVEDQKENMQIRSYSVGAKSILGPRSLSVESAAGKSSGAVKSSQNVTTVAADAQIMLLTSDISLCQYCLRCDRHCNTSSSCL